MSKILAGFIVLFFFISSLFTGVKANVIKTLNLSYENGTKKKSELLILKHANSFLNKLDCAQHTSHGSHGSHGSHSSHVSSS